MKLNRLTQTHYNQIFKRQKKNHENSEREVLVIYKGSAIRFSANFSSKHWRVKGSRLMYATTKKKKKNKKPLSNKNLYAAKLKGNSRHPQSKAEEIHYQKICPMRNSKETPAS